MTATGYSTLSDIRELHREAAYLYQEAGYGPAWKRQYCKELHWRISERILTMAAKGIVA